MANTASIIDPVASGGTIADTDGLVEGTSNLYHTDARVTANPTVAANTTNAATALTTATTANTAAGAANALAVTANAGVAANDADITALQTGKADTSAIPTNYVKDDASDVMTGASYVIDPASGQGFITVKGTAAWVQMWDKDLADQDLARSAWYTSGGTTALRKQGGAGANLGNMLHFNHTTKQATLYGDVQSTKTGAGELRFTGTTQGRITVADSGAAAHNRAFTIQSDDGVAGFYSLTDAGVPNALWRARTNQGVSFGNPGSGIPTTRGHINAEEIFRNGVIAGINLFANDERVVTNGTATGNTPFNLTNVAVNSQAVVLRVNNTGTSTDRFSITDATNVDYWTRPRLLVGEAQILICPKTKGNTTLRYRRYNDGANSALTIDVLGFIG